MTLRQYLTTALIPYHTALTTADRGMLQLQRRLLNYRGTLTGKKLLKEGVLKKVNRRGVPKDCTLFVVRAREVRNQRMYNRVT